MFLRISKMMSALVVTLFFLGALPSGAAVSTACDQETNVLYANSNFQSILVEYALEYGQKIADSCDFTLTSNATCTINFNTFLAAANYKTACLSAGGQVFISDSTLVCSYNSLSFTYNLNNQVLCVGQSCNKNDIQIGRAHV